MKRQFLFLLLFIPVILFSCSNNNNKGTGERPTKEDVATTMKKAYEYTTTAGDVYKIEINDIKIGNSQIANLRQELENIPKGTMITNVLVDYSITGFINAKKKSKLWMYKNEFGEWKLKSGSPD